MSFGRRSSERTLLASSALLSLAAAAWFVVATLRWPLVGDATLLHYCVLMMRDGYAPDRQLIDINLPGTYFFEWLVIRLFGYGALPWRLFDLSLLACLGLSANGILKEGTALPRGSRVCMAVWASCLFAVLHGRDGVGQLGQRDLLMTVWLSLGCWALLGARAARRSLAPVAAFGIAIGIAATIKPLAIVLLPGWLACLLAADRENSAPRTGLIAAASLTGLLPPLGCILWLAHAHALSAFVAVLAGLVPLHQSLFHLAPWQLAARSVSSVLLAVVLFALPPIVSLRPGRSVTGAVLLLGVGFGAASFWLQGRGYPYHRYPLTWFLLLLAAWALPSALQHGSRLLRASAMLAIAWSVLVVLPASLVAISRFTPRLNPQGKALHAALLQQGNLNDRVQCVDMAGGCVTELLTMRLEQSTGFLYDCYAMARVQPRFIGEQQRYRNAWATALERRPPAVFVVFNDPCGRPEAPYELLDRWPWLTAFLQEKYSLEEDWHTDQRVDWVGHGSVPYGFRVYRLRSAGA